MVAPSAVVCDSFPVEQSARVFSMLILIIVVIALPETYQPAPHYSLHPKAIIGNFLEVIKNRQFMTYAMARNTVSAALFA
jgi:DHA1 family bicyclomycin/chloramphenicol resistance-like MFS transporter